MARNENRKSSKQRKTGETEVDLSLDLDGSGAEISTGVGFFDHMLDSLARHSGIGLEVSAKGDLETGSHHTVEDVGIVLGQALDEALGELEADHDYLTKGDVFTQDLIESWIGWKREKEVDPMRLRPHPYEFSLYYDN